MNKIVIAGAGTMGASMAQIFAEYFDDVVLYNHRQATLDRAKEQIETNVAALVQGGALKEDKAKEILNALTYTTSMECYRDCDFVCENIAEDEKIKADFYTKVSEIAKPEAIITTNTSGLSVNLIAKSVKNPKRFLGMHWFNPPHLVPLIEIIKADETSDESAKIVYDLCLTIKKKPVIINKDIPGFVGNRIQFAVLREALDLVSKGVVSPEGMDDVMKYGLGYRYACLGPLEVSDFGGLDVFYHVASYLMRDLCDSKEAPEILKQHFEAGEFGVKSGKGFYDYSGEKAAQKTAERDEKYRKLYHALYE